MEKRVLGWIRKYLKTSKTAPQRQDGYRSQPPPREFQSIQVPRMGQAQHEEQGASSRGPAFQSCLPGGSGHEQHENHPREARLIQRSRRNQRFLKFSKGLMLNINSVSGFIGKKTKNPMIILGHQTFCYTSAWFWWVCVYNERIYIYTYSKCITHT